MTDTGGMEEDEKGRSVKERSRVVGEKGYVMVW